MNTVVFVFSIVILAGLLPVIFNTSKARIVSATCTAIAILLPLGDAFQTIISNDQHSLYFPGGVLFETLHCKLDALSSLFLIPTVLVISLSLLYSLKAVTTYKRFTSLWQNLLILSMISIITSHNALQFIIAWEIMSLTSLLLVMANHHDASKRKASHIYFVLTHVGAAFLIPFFILITLKSGSLLFGSLEHALTGAGMVILFITGLVGFGSKAALFPFHIWAPQAYPAPQPHISAIMSGAMVNMGLYGIFRMISFFNTMPLWWGFSLIIVGAISGMYGILNACAQTDLKRLLAYSSIENSGIMVLATGIGMIGHSLSNPFLMVSGFGGALLHMINHSFFKSLLFMSVGDIEESTGSSDMEMLGGFQKKSPPTAALFFIGSVAICGLPPLNGFISEFIIFIAGVNGIFSQTYLVSSISLLAVISLGCIGSLALFGFAKAYGVAFLGEPRSNYDVRKISRSGTIPQFILAGFCFLSVITPLLFTHIFRHPLQAVTGVHELQLSDSFTKLESLSHSLIIVLSVFTVVTVLTVTIRLLYKTPARKSVTWDCGYARPTSRMQYTGTSFVHPLLSFFKSILKPVILKKKPSGLFPTDATCSETYNDVIDTKVYRPLFVNLVRFCAIFNRLQNAHTNIHVLYITAACVATLIIVLVNTL